MQSTITYTSKTGSKTVFKAPYGLPLVFGDELVKLCAKYAQTEDFERILNNRYHQCGKSIIECEISGYNYSIARLDDGTLQLVCMEGRKNGLDSYEIRTIFEYNFFETAL